MASKYTKSEFLNSVIRSGDGAVLLWDIANDRPADIDGLAGRIWRADGSPASLPYVAPPRVVPDNPTLSDWRVGLLLWGRLDDVTSRIAALCEAGEVMGFVARERFEYSNNVLRKELLQLKDVLGFTEAEVDESLWRASMVAAGDLSGIWLG